MHFGGFAHFVHYFGCFEVHFDCEHEDDLLIV